MGFRLFGIDFPSPFFQNLPTLLIAGITVSCHTPLMVTRNQIISTIIGVVAAAGIGYGAWYYKQAQIAENSRSQSERKTKPRLLTEFDPLLEKPALVNVDTALGHRLTIQSGKGSRFWVSLYFVECPPVESNETTNETLARLSRYFGDVPLEKVIEGGKAAREFSLNQLSTRPFAVATLYRTVKTGQGIWGFIMLRAEDNTDEYLAELLVRNGLAAISVEGCHLPYGEPASEFRQYLIHLEKEARAAKRGLWAWSRHESDGGAPPEAP